MPVRDWLPDHCLSGLERIGTWEPLLNRHNVAATALTTDRSRIPMRDNTRWPEKSATPSFGNKISDENAAGHSNGLATVTVLKILLDLKRPVTDTSLIYIR
jgi:hypothetical protein